VLRPPGRVSDLHPPFRHHFLMTLLLSPSSSVTVPLFCHPPPSNRRRYAFLVESRELTAIAGSALPSSRSSPLPQLLGVPLSPSLPLSSSALPPSGREKHPHPRRAVEDGPVIRPQSRGHRRRCQCRRCHPRAPSSPFCLCHCPDGWPQPIPRHDLQPDGIVFVNLCHCP